MYLWKEKFFYCLFRVVVYFYGCAIDYSRKLSEIGIISAKYLFRPSNTAHKVFSQLTLHTEMELPCLIIPASKLSIPTSKRNVPFTIKTKWAPYLKRGRHINRNTQFPDYFLVFITIKIRKLERITLNNNNKKDFELFYFIFTQRHFFIIT